MSVGKFAFLPNLRSAFAAEANRVGVRLRTSCDLEIMGDGAAQGSRVPIAAQLKGPGDVVGIEPSQIVRVEPEDTNKGFEPNYFPFIEFRDPDLPWRYSLDTGTDDQLSPWCVLIALKDDEFTFLDQGSALAPRIQVVSANDSLPRLDQAWAFAHVQVDMDGVAGSPEQIVTEDPGRGFSRLFAFRQLEADTHYTLFLVPGTKAGVEAALIGEVDASVGAAPAWGGSDEGAITLPYYFRHRFRTDAGQDLEVLLRKLRAVKADEKDEAGAPLWVSAEDVGYYDGLVLEGYGFEAQAALSQPDYDVPEYDTPQRLQQKMVKTLDTVLAEQADEDDEDPLLTFPAHGAHYAEADQMRPARAESGHWFHRTNLDLKFRAAAGLGRKIVKENDEHFAQLCWEQYDEVMAANRSLQQLQIASLLAGKLDSRHYSRLPSEAGVQLAEPLLSFTRSDPSDIRAPSIRADLQEKNLPDGFASLALRRVVARKPVRAVQADNKQILRKMPLAPLPGDETPSQMIDPERPSALTRRRAALVENSGRLRARDAAGSVFNPEYLNEKKRARIPEPQVGRFSSTKVQKLVAEKLVALPKTKADFLISGRSNAEEEAGGIIWRAPRVPEPLADHLIRVSRDALLSNVQALPDNTVSFYEENRAFVEALMLGANHAMNEELRWREYPTDMRGTIFHRFWNRGAEADDTTADDIRDIRQWSGQLGKQDNPADVDGKANLVVVIKGEVVRKLRDPLVAVSIAAGEEWDPETATDYDPVFFGKLGRDAVYYGFDISREYVLSNDVVDRTFFAIYEPPARLRFGLDVGRFDIRRSRPTTPRLAMAIATPSLQKWDDLSWAHMTMDAAGYVDFSEILVKPALETENFWGTDKHSAGLARSFWQKPLAALLPLKRVL